MSTLTGVLLFLASMGVGIAASVVAHRSMLRPRDQVIFLTVVWIVWTCICVMLVG